MDSNYEKVSNAGIPYQDIRWYDIEGQPFGTASNFNAIIFNDANNIIDTKGAMAVGGDFNSPRGLSIAFGNNSKFEGTGYSPDLVRFLVGGNVSIRKPLVVIGHVVVGGNFEAAPGSTYLIGKDNTSTQQQDLEYLYQASGGSNYWSPSDKGDHYLISSYDVPRYIPASRIEANLSLFFQNARKSIIEFKNCIEKLPINGRVIDNFHELVLRGNNPNQNVFYIDVRPTGTLNKGIRAEVPGGSLVIVRLRTGNNAHLQYGLFGEQRMANNTLYVFEDADNIFMEVPADIWGSILAPQAMFHGHSTGGHVSGNVALSAFAVNANSGFEFHLFPFAGGVICQENNRQIPEVIIPPISQPAPASPQPEACPECPEVIPCPDCPEAVPCPQPEPCPTCPTCPQPEPCPTCPTCPQPEPCPTCPTCPQPEPCPVCPTYPQAEPCPECPPQRPCPKTPDGMILPGIIAGCIWGCECYRSHHWEIRLYKIYNDNKILLCCDRIDSFGYFKFTVPFKGYYLLSVCPFGVGKKTHLCKALVSFKNIGVSNFMIE